MKWEVRTMRSGTSLFNWPVFKKTVLRFWPVWGAYSAIWLVALPLQGLMMLQLEAQARPGLTDGYMRRFAQSVPEMAHMAMVLALVFGVLAAMAVCSHLYNARSANFFGSLPVRREGLFATHYLAGLAFLVVPNAAIFLLTLLIEAIGGTVLLPGLGFWLAVACGECFFFYSLAVFCGMFTGHILALPAFYGIFNVLTWALCVLASAVFHRFYYGFNGFGPWMQTLIEWLTPVMKLGSGVGGWYADGLFQTRGLDSVAAYAAAALLLADGLDAEAVERAIYRTGYYGLDIITSNLELYAADRALYDRQDTDTARVLSSVLDHVRNDYDFCIIDNGPSVDTVTLNVLAAADDVLIPIRPDEFSFSGLLDLVEQVQAVQERVNPGLTLRGAFFTHWQNRETFAQARRSLEDSGICPVLQTAISYNPKVPESTLEEKPLCVFAPRSWAAIQYKKLTAEYLALTDSDKGVKSE